MSSVLAYIFAMKRAYSTAQVARMIRVHKRTLIRWLLEGKVGEPKRVSIGLIDSRIWADRDVERVRRYRAANYRKGRGRKKKPKACDEAGRAGALTPNAPLTTRPT
jgi:hypothetical protein